MFENLTDKLERSFKILKGEGRITEINVAETLKEIRRALIDADVNYKVAKTFTDEVKQKALGQDVLKAVKPGQMMTKIVRDSLAELMGGTATDIRLEGTPAVVLIAGLQGSGKTTFSGKLASFIKSKKGRQVLLVANLIRVFISLISHRIISILTPLRFFLPCILYFPKFLSDRWFLWFFRGK